MHEIDDEIAESLFRALGERLGASGSDFRIVVVGGVALLLGGFVRRVTKDVDVIALVDPGSDRLESSQPLPEPLRAAVRRVAVDFGLSDDWLNGAVGAQLPYGLPPAFTQDLTWRRYGGLHVGLAGRSSLIALKLYAGVDDGLRSKHVSDLVALAPTDLEWARAAAWVRRQDTAPEFPRLVEEVIAHVDERVRQRP